MAVISSEKNRHTQDKEYEDFNDYIAYINPDRRNILYETCGYQLVPIPDSNGSNPTPSTGNSANDIVIESHESHYNAKRSVRNPSPAVVPQGAQVKGQAKDDQGCNCWARIEVMESQRYQAKSHAQQLKKQNKILHRDNCNLQEYNDRVRPENEKLSIRLRTLRDLIYRIESRVIVYSDYIDKVKEALGEGVWILENQRKVWCLSSLFTDTSMIDDRRLEYGTATLGFSSNTLVLLRCSWRSTSRRKFAAISSHFCTFTHGPDVPGYGRVSCLLRTLMSKF
jgi:hypothetical protein